MIGANGCLTWHSDFEEARLYRRWASPLEGIMDSHSEVSPPLRCYNKDRSLVARFFAHLSRDESAAPGYNIGHLARRVEHLFVPRQSFRDRLEAKWLW